MTDISAGGAGLILAGPTVEQDARFTLQLEVAERDAGLQRLEATVKHVTMSPDGTMHIGVEFAPDDAALVVVQISDELAPILGAI